MHVFKTTQGVFRSIGNKQENEIYAETPDFFKPENIPENWEEFTFTTETGKVVKGIKFKTPKGEEIWLSSEVPFGIVKYIIGNYTVELRDFGEGEKIKISIEEVKNATIVG
ncbi:MAG TPA: hypothetical protein EYH54_00090 [Nautiliaceae bacterium]|nr:hypothetical protein [Nautiliaceae bacterium]